MRPLETTPYYFLLTQPTRTKPWQRKNYIHYLNSACLMYLFILLETFMLVHIILMIQGAHRRCANQLKIKKEWKGVNVKTVTITPDILFDTYLALSSCLPDNVSLWTTNLCDIYFTALISEVVDMLVSEKFIIPKLQLLTSKETQLNAIQSVREVESLSYKTLQEYNESMIKRIESIMRTERCSVSFTHAEDTNTNNNPHINGRTYFQ